MSPKSKTKKIKEYGKIESFFLYKVIYPFVNLVGLNRLFNIFWHKIGRYHERGDGMCWWCGEYHRGHFEQNFPVITNDSSEMNSNPLTSIKPKK